MHRILILIFVLGAMTPRVHAQADLNGLYDNNANLANANYFPSHLGMDPAKFQLDIFRGHAYAGATNLSRTQVQSVLDSDSIGNSEVNAILGALGTRTSQFLFGTRIQPINFAININDRLTLGAGVQDRLEYRLALDARFLELLWRGNRSFGGQTVDLGELMMNLSYQRTYYIAGAYSLMHDDDLEVRVGGRLQLLQGITSIYAPDNNVSIYTEPNGKYLDIVYDYRVNTALPLDGNGELDFDPFRAAGNGFGIDLGANVRLGNLHGSIGITDLGGVRYNNNVENYYQSDSIRFEGVEVSNAFSGVTIEDSAFVASLSEYKTGNEDFTNPLPAKISLQAAYRIRGTNVDGNTYYKGSLFLTYIQGLNANSTFGTNAIVSVGGAYDVGNIFNVGGQLSTVNFNDVRLGLFGSFRLVFLRFGVGTTNILPLVSSNATLTTDVNFHLGINF